MYLIQNSIFYQIKQNLYLPEMGGILGININDRHTVTDFYFDSIGTTEKNCYTPDVETLNRVIAKWAENGIEFIGFVHSHPNSIHLSRHDIEYANKIMRACNMPEIIMMIYIPETQELHQYVLHI